MSVMQQTPHAPDDGGFLTITELPEKSHSCLEGRGDETHEEKRQMNP